MKIRKCCDQITVPYGEGGGIYEKMGSRIESEGLRFNVLDGDGYYALQDIKYCPYCGKKLARQIE